VDELPLVVIKKDGRREIFNRTKLIRGLLTACHKRPVTREEIERVADEVEREVRNRMETEVPSHIIGELVVDKLRRLDEVAYVRFASVYREFRDGRDFKDYLNPRSLEVLTSCRIEPGLARAAPGSIFQFERQGYFCVDPADSSPGKPVFNRAVTLRDTWSKIERAQKKREGSKI